jgi:L-ascorbate metabolism protein UlaG (beta-lactamase superfamily)
VGAPSDHFDGSTFHNVPKKWEPTVMDLLTWQLGPGAIPWAEDHAHLQTRRKPASHEQAIVCTMVNHATVLIQLEGVNVLTDPVWSERASPVSWAGPRRHRAPGIAFEDLPPIDIVVISHNHHDHCDKDTLVRLAQKHHPLFLGGLGTRALLADFGVGNAIDLDWWSEKQFGKITVGFAPAQHWSGRSLGDRNNTLWGSFFIAGIGTEARKRSVYFAGDTGWGPHFKEVRERFGAPAVALLPIGAYAPAWFMHPHHTSPSEAVTAHQTLGAGQSYGIHWGTFDLSDEGEYQPAGELGLALDKAQIPRAKFLALENSESGDAHGLRQP